MVTTPQLSPQGPSRAAERAYLVLLALGVVLPYKSALPWIVEHGADVPRFVQDILATRISRFFGWDVIVTSATVVVLAADSGDLRPHERLAVAVGALAGSSVGLPTYLYLTARRKRRLLENTHASWIDRPGRSVQFTPQAYVPPPNTAHVPQVIPVRAPMVTFFDI